MPVKAKDLCKVILRIAHQLAIPGIHFHHGAFRIYAPRLILHHPYLRLCTTLGRDTEISRTPFLQMNRVLRPVRIGIGLDVDSQLPVLSCQNPVAVNLVYHHACQVADNQDIRRMCRRDRADPTCLFEHLGGIDRHVLYRLNRRQSLPDRSPDHAEQLSFIT